VPMRRAAPKGGGHVDARVVWPSSGAAVGLALVEALWGCASAEDCDFARGYAGYGGPVAYLQHFIEDVLPCEGGPDWSITDYHNSYISRLQFSPGSWRAAAAATGRDDGADPYAVGANAAWWVQHIDSPGGTGGWPVCWWRGLVP
jgi:hypothetical protein